MMKQAFLALSLSVFSTTLCAQQADPCGGLVGFALGMCRSNQQKLQQQQLQQQEEQQELQRQQLQQLQQLQRERERQAQQEQQQRQIQDQQIENLRLQNEILRKQLDQQKSTNTVATAICGESSFNANSDESRTVALRDE
jgi:hypothetical protein